MAIVTIVTINNLLKRSTNIDAIIANANINGNK